MDVEAILAAEATERASSTNISYFAFTATPKAKTLELFGRTPAGTDRAAGAVPRLHDAPGDRGGLHPRRPDRLPLLQAARSRSARTLQAAAAEVDQAQATKAGDALGQAQPADIAQKAAIIVEHFQDNVAHLLDGHAKAMVVTDSRKAAVRYKLAIDKIHRQEGLRLRHAGRVLRHRPGPRVRARRLHRGDHEPRPARSADVVPRRRVQGDDRRQQVPDRLRPAAAVRDVCRPDPVRGDRRADSLAAQPHIPSPRRAFRRPRHDTGRRLRQRPRRHPGRVPSRTSPTLSSRPQPTRTWSTTSRASSTLRHLHAGRSRPVRRGLS